MEIDEIAKEIIDLVQGISTDKTVEGVVEVLKGVKQAVHNDWEQYLAKETNEALMFDNVGCPICHSRIEVERTRNYVAVRDV